MKKVTIITILILVVCMLQAENTRGIRIISSGLFFGNYSCKSTNIFFLSETTIVTTKFPIIYSLGIELEGTLKNNLTKGIGFSIIPQAEQITDGIFDDSDNVKHKLGDIYILYLYNKVVDSFGKSNFYARINYGTGLPYFFYGAFGAGFDINDRWNIEATLNGHYSTVLWASSSITYLNIKIGFRFKQISEIYN